MKRIKNDTKNIPHLKMKDLHLHVFSFAETEEMFSNLDPMALAGTTYVLI